MARFYCDAVLSGREPACLYVRQAVKRYLRMLDEAAGGQKPYYFSIEDAVDVCDFAEKMPHIEGVWETENLVLQPVQCFWLCAIFGFRRVANDTRLVRTVYLEIPRKHGKSLLIAILCLYCWLCEGETGAQVYIGAPKEEQAEKVYGPIKALLERQPDLMARFKVKKPTSRRVVKLDDENAYIRIMASVGRHEDGHNPHVVAMEELHAQDHDLYDVMRSSLGARKNSLFISIGTAGRRSLGPGWEERKKLIAVLSGKADMLHVFGVIYTIDEDRAKDERYRRSHEAVLMANPLFGISVQSDQVEEFLREAQQNPERLIEFDRTRLNIWSNAAGGLFSVTDWEACTVPTLKIEDFRGRPAWIGGDLASKLDIASVGVIVEVNPNVIAVFCQHFIPSDAPAFMSDIVGPQYQYWRDHGHLTVTEGAIINYGFIESAIMRLSELLDIQAIIFDAYQSNQILASLHDKHLPTAQMMPGVKYVSDPTEDLVARARVKQIQHDGDPVLAWMVGNTVGYRDQRSNVLPKKDSPNSPFKIDGVSALVMANAARLNAQLDIPVKPKSVYAERGLLGFGGDGNRNGKGPSGAEGDDS